MTLPCTDAGAGIAVTGTGRIVAQRGLFLGPDLRMPEDLYARVDRGTATRERTRVVVHPGGAVSTNTYFGRFHATYWQRWTAVTDVEIDAVVTGTGRVRLLASDTNKVWRIVDGVEVRGADGAAVRLVAAIDRFVDGGGLWLEITTEAAELTVADVRWTVATPREPAGTDVTICTHDRVAECLATLAALAADPEALASVDLVRVVDHGETPVSSSPRFAEVAAVLGDRLVHVRQANLGGAGGFSRGLVDAARRGHDSLFMDDDVLVDPEILVRLTAFAAATAHPTIVGGQMLNLLHPTHLHTSAERADPERLTVGIAMPDALVEAHLLGRDERLLPIGQERRVDTEYNGWWACLVPAAVVQAIGYPLPLFFQWDDIEFGYRARAHGFPTVSLPGAGLWHADFGWKDWDEWHRYFNLRNGLIMAALHTGFAPRRITSRLGQLLAQYLVAMHYGLAATLLAAVEEFLAGPGILDDGSTAAAERIRRVRSEYPETVVHPMHELAELVPDFRDAQIVRAANEPGNERLTWLKRAVYHAAGRPGRVGAVPAGDNHWWHVSTFERAVVTDMGETGFRLRVRDRDRALRLARRGAHVLRRFLREGPVAAERYRAAMPELTSEKNWARLFETDRCG